MVCLIKRCKVSRLKHRTIFIVERFQITFEQKFTERKKQAW